MIKYRKATADDTSRILEIYSNILDIEESRPESVIGWKRDIYPTIEVVNAALERDDMYVQFDTELDMIVGSAIINKVQLDCYRDISWKYEPDATDDEVMVLHTLTIDPRLPKSGYGTQFAEFYRQVAAENNCKVLRIDTSESNYPARSLYKKLGYVETEIIFTSFNDIEGYNLVLLEREV